MPYRQRHRPAKGAEYATPEIGAPDPDLQPRGNAHEMGELAAEIEPYQVSGDYDSDSDDSSGGRFAPYRDVDASSGRFIPSSAGSEASSSGGFTPYAVADASASGGFTPYAVADASAAGGFTPYAVADATSPDAAGSLAHDPGKGAPLPPTLTLASAARKRKAVEDRRPQARKDWHDDIASRAGSADTPLITRQVQDEYVGEETLQEAGGVPKAMLGKTATGTHYANSAGEFGTQIEGGLKRDGQALHSVERGASSGTRPLYKKDKEQRLNFAMDAAGGFYTADPKQEVLDRADPVAMTTERFNHTTLLGGADAAAAGSVKVRDGQVEELDDASGHYKPSAVHTYQAVSALTDAGAMDEMRSTVSLSRKGPSQEDMKMSTLEFLAYEQELQAAAAVNRTDGGDRGLADPERKMRQAHLLKGEMLDDLGDLGDDPKTSLHAPDLTPRPPVEEQRARSAARKAAAATKPATASDRTGAGADDDGSVGPNYVE